MFQCDDHLTPSFVIIRYPPDFGIHLSLSLLELASSKGTKQIRSKEYSTEEYEEQGIILMAVCGDIVFGFVVMPWVASFWSSKKFLWQQQHSNKKDYYHAISSFPRWRQQQ